MTQLAPTTIVQAQAVSLVRNLQSRYLNREFKHPEDIANDLKTALTTFLNQVGRPLFQFDGFELGEPVLSEKMNRLQKMLQDDINILSDQSEYLQAATIFLFNYVNTEIQKAKNENSQASNKLKTLQLYSSAHDPDVIIFGDYFLNDEQLDLTKMPIDQRAIIQYPGFLTLDKATSNSEKILKSATVTVLPSSNGFLGNNQEIDLKSFASPAAAFIEPAGVQDDVQFVSQTDRHALLKGVIDGDPTTWIEYEYYLVSEKDREKAKGFNFTYRTPDPSDGSKEILVDWASGPGFTVASESVSSLNGFKYVPGPDAGVLKLDMEIDLQELRRINSVTLTPYAMQDNKNHPILVSKVETSENSSTWIPVQPTDMWIANDKNLDTARIADNSVTGNGVWVFPERTARYVRFQIRQKNPVDSKIGHVYWQTKVDTKAKMGVSNVGIGLTETSVLAEEVVNGERKLGPVPPITSPAMYNDPKYVVSGDLVKKVEVFDGKRWGIGIRDVTVDNVAYKTSGIIVSKAFKINGIIDRVSLEADVEIPEIFPEDEAQLWVKFFVSPDDGINWFPISRIQDDFLGLPEVIAFNDPLPEEYREVGVGYQTVAGSVNSIRLKIELLRPSSATENDANVASTQESLSLSSSPIVRSYKLKVRSR